MFHLPMHSSSKYCPLDPQQVSIPIAIFCLLVVFQTHGTITEPHTKPNIEAKQRNCC